ncbi:NAD(P) transhydrogenase subunit alpha [Alteromonas sp. ASW11-36]|uniref:proton-translocating NAD(P)(+) transhydrogenase n=1 Tax=Alteromonas arenosi TaxID=3055817 RepID=A0ABT7SYB3_9ALTE|nr:NAD(P) transhydrogenase subunit alpha [Alteromonas sp. ASW11-36]MDM7860519.1 NAD(P) transhydrogenase subunit alpha [Alteromonas sp. ASW11-36]
MKIVVLKESDAADLTDNPTSAERRCSATPATVAKYSALGAEVLVEANAGVLAGFSDTEYNEAGALIVDDRNKLLSQADILLYVNRPSQADINIMQPSAIVIGHLDPFFEQETIEQLVAKGTTALSVEMIPRSTRSQKMDALSSQSNLAGYVMVMNAAAELDSILPMMMTPAGTVNPAKVFIIGAGVAGLQAIATAKRLGAQVTAFDTRPVVEEQVKSLGAKFLNIDLGDTGQSQQGYANALSAEQQAKQKAGQHAAIAAADIVITTAQLFGRKPPQIVSAEDIRAMKPGSVVVDMAAESGGNVEGSVAGETRIINGVKIVGTGNWVNQVPKDATNLYANNLYNLIEDYWDKESNTLNLDFTDDILDASVVCHARVLRNELLRKQFSKTDESAASTATQTEVA